MKLLAETKDDKSLSKFGRIQELLDEAKTPKFVTTVIKDKDGGDIKVHYIPMPNL